MSDMKIIIVGAAGRMGQSLAALARDYVGVALVGLIEAAGHQSLGAVREGIAITDDVGQALAAAGPRCGLIDFTRAGGPAALAALAARHDAVYVVGTTALSDEDKRQVAQAAKKIPVIASGNMSFGVALLASFARRAAEVLSPQDWDIEIREIHHRNKIDAPSGTAFLLGEAAAKGRRENLDDLATYHAPAGDRARQKGAIGFSASRGGSIAGIHEVVFAGPDEVLTLTHQATSREIFALGALRACLWGREQKAGLFDISDVLEL